MSRLLASVATSVTLIAFAAGCESPEPARDAAPADGTVEAPTQAQPDMQGDELQSRLNDHIRTARAADVQQFRQMFPQHRDLVMEMLNDCRQMMRQMNMTPPRQFTQVETALEADLQRIPTMSDADLQSLLPHHLDRMQTVIDMRQDMMDDM
jgi:hypothetical protein